LFLSSRISDPKCASRIRILIFYPSHWIPDPDPQPASKHLKRENVFVLSTLQDILLRGREGNDSILCSSDLAAVFNVNFFFFIVNRYLCLWATTVTCGPPKILKWDVVYCKTIQTLSAHFNFAEVLIEPANGS
jgi:hypothetical protein